MYFRYYLYFSQALKDANEDVLILLITKKRKENPGHREPVNLEKTGYEVFEPQQSH